MATLNIGRVCIKTAGREAGRFCIVLKKIDDNFVSVTGPKILTGVKRRRCNVDHLEPTEHFLEVKAETGEKDVISAYEKAGLLKKLGLRKPSPEVVKEAVKKEKPKKEKPEKKTVKKEEPKKEIKIKLPTLRKAKKPEEKKKPEKKPKPAKKVKPKKEKSEKKKKTKKK